MNYTRSAIFFLVILALVLLWVWYGNGDPLKKEDPSDLLNNLDEDGIIQPQK